MGEYGSDSASLRRQVLENRLKALESEYRAINKQIDNSLDSAGKERLKRQSDDLFKEIEEAETGLRSLAGPAHHTHVERPSTAESPIGLPRIVYRPRKPGATRKHTPAKAAGGVSYLTSSEGMPVECVVAVGSGAAADGSLVACLLAPLGRGVRVTPIVSEPWNVLASELRRLRAPMLHLSLAGDAHGIYWGDGGEAAKPIEYGQLFNDLSSADPKLLVLHIHQRDGGVVQGHLFERRLALFDGRGVRGYVVTQQPINPQVSLRFARHFYAALAAHYSLSFAFAFAQRGLASDKAIEASQRSRFMTQQTCEIIPFPQARPALATVPRWASAPPPSIDTLFALLRLVDEAREQLSSLRDTLSEQPIARPRDLRLLNTQQDCLDNVVEAFADLEYSGEEMTRWKNDVLIVANEAAGCFKECWSTLELLYNHGKVDQLYRKLVARLQAPVDSICQYNTELVAHVERLLFRVGTDTSFAFPT